MLCTDVAWISFNYLLAFFNLHMGTKVFQKKKKIDYTKFILILLPLTKIHLYCRYSMQEFCIIMLGLLLPIISGQLYFSLTTIQWIKNTWHRHIYQNRYMCHSCIAGVIPSSISMCTLKTFIFLHNLYWIGKWYTNYKHNTFILQWTRIIFVILFIY